MDFVKKTPLLEIYIILIFFSLSITINSIGLIPKYLVILFFIFFTFCFLAFFIKEKITINQNLRYSISLFNFRILDKVIVPKDITLVEFKRVGWNQKCIIIKSTTGKVLKVINFKPDSIYDEVEKFVVNNKIKAEFAKDYRYIK